MTEFILKNINIEPLLKAELFLKNGIETASSDLEKAGAIQGFEFCYELSWKTMKKILDYRGIQVASPRETFRASAKEGFIKDPEIWFGFITKRNQTAHTYNQDIANEVFLFLPNFHAELIKFIESIKKLS